LCELARENGPAVLAFFLHGREPGEAVVSSRPPRDRTAVDWRHDAADACRQSEYGACARDLDEARALDPAGEALPEVRAMRQAIERATLDGGAPR
jgi:hypothetical protein